MASAKAMREMQRSTMRNPVRGSYDMLSLVLATAVFVDAGAVGLCRDFWLTTAVSLAKAAKSSPKPSVVCAPSQGVVDTS